MKRASFLSRIILGCWMGGIACFAPVHAVSAPGPISAVSAAATVTFQDPLVDAADRGQIEQVKERLKTTADVNRRGLFEVTALMRASYQGHLEIVRILLEKGARTDAMDLGGATALHFAARQGHPEVAHLLLERGAYVNATDNEGWTPLMRATLKGNRDMVTLLLGSGARTDMENNRGSNAAVIAKEQKQTQVLALIKEAEEATPDVTITDLSREQPAIATAPQAELAPAAPASIAPVAAAPAGYVKSRSFEISVSSSDQPKEEPALPTQTAALPAPVPTASAETAMKKSPEKTLTSSAPSLEQFKDLAEIHSQKEQLSLEELRGKIDQFLDTHRLHVAERTETQIAEDRARLMREFTAQYANAAVSAQKQAAESLKQAQLAAAKLEADLSLAIAEKQASDHTALFAESFDKTVNKITSDSLQLTRTMTSPLERNVAAKTSVASAMAPATSVVPIAKPAKPVIAASSSQLAVRPTSARNASAAVSVPALKVAAADLPEALPANTPSENAVAPESVFVKIPATLDVPEPFSSSPVTQDDIHTTIPTLVIRLSGDYSSADSRRKVIEAVDAQSITPTDGLFVKQTERHAMVVGPLHSYQEALELCSLLRRTGDACATLQADADSF